MKSNKIISIAAAVVLLAIYQPDIARGLQTYCPDPLNVQANRADTPASPASACSGGIVTCGSGSTASACGVSVAFSLYKSKIFYLTL